MNHLQKRNDLFRYIKELCYSPLLKKLILLVTVLGAGVVGISYVSFIIYWTWQKEGWVKDIVKEHFAATIGLPLAGVAAYLLVSVLEYSYGKIEIEIWGLKFKGATGPVILWMLCFFIIAISIKMLW